MWKGVISTTLPVQISQFSGVVINNSSHLRWVTAAETNNKGFEVERSYDGQQFRVIGFVPGAISSSSDKTYTFQDRDIAQNENFYRLKQVDLDGNISYSNIILLKNKMALSSSMKLLRNPVRSSVDVELPARQSDRLSVRIIDMNGKVVLKQVIATSQTRIRIETGNSLVSKAVYVLTVSDGSQEYRAKLIKE
jgi:hypothetical protein